MKTPNASSSQPREPSHDSGYKLLYSHAAMVRDLLRGFVPGAWLHALDLTTLERCSGSYVTDDLRDRADDIIWRLRWGSDWLKAPEQTALRRAFAVWFGRVFLPKRLPGVQLPPLGDLSEVYDMLADNLETWTDQWKQQGLEQGLEQGRRATRHLLVRQVRRRFGPTIAAQTEPLLAQVTDLQTLEELGDQLLVSPDGHDWLRALRGVGSNDKQ